MILRTTMGKKLVYILHSYHIISHGPESLQLLAYLFIFVRWTFLMKIDYTFFNNFIDFLSFIGNWKRPIISSSYLRCAICCLDNVRLFNMNLVLFMFDDHHGILLLF